MTSPSDISSLPKWITPVANASGVLTTARVFGKKDCLNRAVSFMLHWLGNEEKTAPADPSTEEGMVLVRERGELRFHCLSVLNRPIPDDLKAMAKAEKWRASRTDSHYALGVLTRSRRALDLIPEKFVPPPDGGDFWDWHAAVVAAGVAAEAQVTAENKAGVRVPPTPGSQVFAPRKKPPAEVAPAPALAKEDAIVAAALDGAVGAGKAGASANVVSVAGGSEDVAPTAYVVDVDASTPPSLAGSKRGYGDVAVADSSHYDAALGISDLELKGVLFLMRTSKVGFEEALTTFKGGRMTRSPVGSSLATSEDSSSAGSTPLAPPRVSRKSGHEISKSFWSVTK